LCASHSVELNAKSDSEKRTAKSVVGKRNTSTPFSTFDDGIDLNKLFPQLFNFGKFYRVCGITLCDLGIDVRFHENAVNSSGHCRARDCGSIFTVAARSSTQTARALDGVCGIHHNGASELAHDKKRAHIGNEIAITEAGPAFTKRYAVVAGRFNLTDNCSHIFRSHKLPLLDIDYSSCFACGYDKISLAGKKRRYLKNIANLRNNGALPRLVNISQNWNIERGADF
jgi:hypothetical protein